MFYYKISEISFKVSYENSYEQVVIFKIDKIFFEVDTWTSLCVKVVFLEILYDLRIIQYAA